MSNNETTKTENSIILDYGDIKVRIVRAGDGNQKYTDIMQTRLHPYKRRLDNGTLNPDIALRLVAEVYADSVILGWEGVKDSKGQILPFTRNNAVKCMIEQSILFENIRFESMNPLNFTD